MSQTTVNSTQKTSVKVSLWRKLGPYDWANNLGIFAYSSASMVFPVLLIAIMGDFGISLRDGGKALAATLSLSRNISMTLSLVASGFVSLYWGNRRCLRFATIISGLFVAFSALSGNFLILLVGLLLVGIGEGLIEGLLTPFVEELHRNEPDYCNNFVNLAHSFWPAGVITATLLAGLLLEQGLSWRWIMGSVALLYFVPSLLLRPGRRHTSTLSRTDSGGTVGEASGLMFRSSMAESLHHIRNIFNTLSYWRFSIAMFLAGGAEISLSFWVASFVQIYYGSSAFIGGMSTAIFSLGMLLGRMLTAHYLPPRLLRTSLLFCAMIGAVASVLLTLSVKLWLFMLLLFFCGLCTAPYWPSIQVYAVQRFPQLNRTLLFILLSTAGIPGAGIFPWLLGLIGDHGTLLANLLQFPSAFVLSFLLVPICHLAIFLLLLRK